MLHNHNEMEICIKKKKSTTKKDVYTEHKNKILILI